MNDFSIKIKDLRSSLGNSKTYFVKEYIQSSSIKETLNLETISTIQSSTVSGFNQPSTYSSQPTVYPTNGLNLIANCFSLINRRDQLVYSWKNMENKTYNMEQWKNFTCQRIARYSDIIYNDCNGTLIHHGSNDTRDINVFIPIRGRHLLVLLIFFFKTV